MSLELDFDTREIQRWGDKLLASEKIVSGELRAGVDRTTAKGDEFTKEGTPLGPTKTLRRSTMVAPATYYGGVAKGSWFNLTPYAPIVESGRGPIVASPGKVLRFKPKGSDTFIYRKRVGPAKGHFMFRKAYQRIKPIYRREMDGAITRIVTRLGGAS